MFLVVQEWNPSIHPPKASLTSTMVCTILYYDSFLLLYDKFCTTPQVHWPLSSYLASNISPLRKSMLYCTQNALIFHCATLWSNSCVFNSLLCTITPPWPNICPWWSNPTGNFYHALLGYCTSLRLVQNILCTHTSPWFVGSQLFHSSFSPTSAHSCLALPWPCSSQTCASTWTCNSVEIQSISHAFDSTFPGYW